MAQKKWELKKEDVKIAHMYISKGLKSDKMYNHRCKEDYVKAKEEFYEIELLHEKENDVYLSALKKWINKNFDEMQLNRLRVKIRTEKSRLNNDRKQMTVDSGVHHRLSQYAKSRNITLSAAIERLLNLI